MKLRKIIIFSFAINTASANIEADKIQHTLPAYQDHHAKLLLDGKADTYFWTARGIKKDETIALQLTRPVPKAHTLIVHDGKPDGKDTFSGAVIEGSLDGKDWKVIGTRRAGILAATMPRPLKHIRLRATRNTGHWVAIRELEITDKKLPLRISRQKIKHQGKTLSLSLACNLDGFADLEPRFESMSSLYFEIWPKLVDMLGSPIDATHRDVNVVFREKMGHPAHASGNTITISANHLRRDPADTTGVFIHELTHVIQRHRGPGWFIEGVADYTRFKLKNDDRWGQRCRRHIPYNKPFGQYWSSAAFLLYLEDTYKKPIVRTVSMAMRAKKYDESLWQKLTGKKLEELAADYKTSGWKPAK